MFSNILGRIIAGIFTMTILFGIRLYFASYLLSQVRAAHTDTAYQLRHKTNTDYVRPPAFPDHSSWVIFNSSDPQSGAITRHAKLAAASAGSPAGLTIPASSIELTAEKGSGSHVFLTLPSSLPCAKLTTLDAQFDGKPPAKFTVIPGNEARCVVEVADAAGFIGSLRDADVLMVQGPGVSDVTFAVSGLNWD
jgi:hypothetical protein